MQNFTIEPKKLGFELLDLAIEDVYSFAEIANLWDHSVVTQVVVDFVRRGFLVVSPARLLEDNDVDIKAIPSLTAGQVEAALRSPALSWAPTDAIKKAGDNLAFFATEAGEEEYERLWNARGEAGQTT